MQDSAIAKLAHVRRQIKAARKGWGEFLVQFSWNWFGTITFRNRVSREKAWQTCHSFLRGIQNTSNTPVGWFAVEGRGSLNGRLHFHILLAGIPSLETRECERVWFRLAGTAVIVEYENRLGAAHYCAGHIDEPGLEYYFSDNLSVFRPRANTNDRQIACTDRDAPVCQNKKQSEFILQVARRTPAPSSAMNISSARSRDQVHDDDDEQNHDDEDQNQDGDSIANPSTQWRDSCGGASMQRRMTPEEVARHEEQLRAQWATTKRAVGAARKATICFGRLCDEARTLGLHKYVHKRDSRKGYVRFEEYIHDLTGGQVSKSRLYQSIDLYLLTQGPNALPDEDVAEMPVQNACLLRRLRPERRTPEIVEAAKRTSKREFPAKVQAKLNEYLPPEQQKKLRVDFFRKLHPTVAGKLEETIERFAHLPVVRDGDGGLTLQEKAIYAICNAAEQFASEDLAAEKRYRRGEVEVSEAKARSSEDRGTPGLLK